MINYFREIFSPDSEFLLLTRDSRRITHIALSSFILPVLFVLISALITQFALAPLVIGDPSKTSPFVREAFGLYSLFGCLILIVFLWVTFFEGRKIQSLGFVANEWFKKYSKGFLLGLVTNSIVVGLIAITGNIEAGAGDIVNVDLNTIGVVSFFLFGFVIQGSAEEILFRGWMFQAIGSRYKPWLGVLLSTVLFSALHLGNSGVNPIGIANLLLFALLMILTVLKEGSIWTVCAWHTSWNWVLGNVYGLSVSGQGSKYSIFNLNAIGDPLISGGEFGPEGSIITTIVLFIYIVILSVLLFRKNKTKITN